MKGYLSIMPRSGLYVREYQDVDAPHFAAVFRSTWLSLPMWARRPMLKRWRDYRHHYAATGINEETRATLLRMPCPLIEIDWSDVGGRQLEGEKINALGAYRAPKFGSGISPRFCFWSEAVRTMPDDALSTLIAHELAHAYLDATGQAVKQTGGDDKDEEFDVADILNDWDYCDNALWALGPIHDWITANRALIDAPAVPPY
jgi:hypothetical protein